MNIERILVNPNEGYGNSPDLVIEGTLPKITSQYTISGGCYWAQDSNGMTDFLYHDFVEKLRKIGPNEYETEYHDGYGGCTFVIDVKNLGKVRIHGPWSGGCYMANNVLPLPACEIEHNKTRKYLAIDVINKWFEDNNKKWRAVLGEFLQGYKKTPRVVYNGLLKENLSKSLLKALQSSFDEDRVEKNYMIAGR